MGGSWRSSCENEHDLFACQSTLSLPAYAYGAEKRLVVRCTAQLGTLYSDWVEGRTRIQLPTEPILGEPLTSDSAPRTYLQGGTIRGSHLFFTQLLVNHLFYSGKASITI